MREKILNNIYKYYPAGIIIAVFLAGLGILSSKTSNTAKPQALLNVEKSAQEIKLKCLDLSNKEQCYGKAFEILTQQSDMDFSFKVLGSLQKIDSEANGCHFIAHSISIAETQKDPARWKEIMNKAPQNCSYGGAHGAIEVYASTFPDGKLPDAEALIACDNPDKNNCTHILGHLALVMKDNDIPESLKICEKLPHDKNGIFECLTGVFMERITAFNLIQHGLMDKSALDWKKRTPELEALCNEQSGIPLNACWKEITHAVLVKVNWDPQALVNFCEKASSQEATKGCIDHAIGIIGGYRNFDFSKTASICDVTTKDSTFKNRCGANLVSSTLSTIPNNSEQAVKFCNTQGKFQKECFIMIGNTLRFSSPENKKAQERACLQSPVSYREQCLNGGSIGIKSSRTGN